MAGKTITRSVTPEAMAREIIHAAKVEPTSWSGELRVETLDGDRLQASIVRALRVALDSARGDQPDSDPPVSATFEA